MSLEPRIAPPDFVDYFQYAMDTDLERDDEFRHACEWIADLARNQGLNFFDKAYLLCCKSVAEDKAKAWMANK